jgi:hypothetical protein
MSKPARLAATEKLRERIVVIDPLRQRMLDLEALRRVVADAEMRANLGREFNSRPERRRTMSRNRIELLAEAARPCKERRVL